MSSTNPFFRSTQYQPRQKQPHKSQYFNQQTNQQPHTANNARWGNLEFSSHTQFEQPNQTPNRFLQVRRRYENTFATRTTKSYFKQLTEHKTSMQSQTINLSTMDNEFPALGEK